MENDSVVRGPMARNGDLLREAQELLAMGFSIIPLRPKTKKPLGDTWKEFQTRRATKEEVHRWFSGTQNNIGIVLGKISGVVVLDGDSPEAVNMIQTDYPSPQRTQTIKGEHHWFKHPPEGVGNRIKINGVDLDVKGEGGYVVAPGSIHPDGGEYTRAGVWGPVDHLPDFPKKLLNHAPEVDPLQGAIDQFLVRMGPAIQGQGGDAKLFMVCCALTRGFALTTDQAMAYLEDWNKECKPPWLEGQLRGKLANARKNGSEPIGARAEQYAQPWMTDLRVNDKGELRKMLINLDIIFRNDARFKGSLELDEMTTGIYWDGEPATDAFPHQLCTRFGMHYLKHPFRKEEIVDAAMAYAHTNKFHPLRNMLYALPAWDGEARIDRIVTEILQGSPTKIANAMMRCFLIGAVRRALQPGCKLDTALVLVGKQGAGKSTFFEILGGKYYSNTPIDAESKDRFLAIHGAWVMELAELDGMTSSKTAQHIKALLSSSEDKFRPPYGRTTVTNRRSCVMVGTTNTTTFLMDPTGSRRFWPIKVGTTMNTPLWRLWRDQVLAEAMVLEASGERHWLSTADDEEREEVDQEFSSNDPWGESVQAALATLAGRGVVLLNGVSTHEILGAMEIPVHQRTRAADLRICASMASIGWESKQKSTPAGRKRLWFPTIGAAVQVAAPVQPTY